MLWTAAFSLTFIATTANPMNDRDRPCDIEVSAIEMKFNNHGSLIDVLDNVTFKVARGDLVCIVGPSGCGKSTLLRIILKLLPQTAGEIKVDARRLNEGVAYVQQGSSLLPWRTLLQNACLGAEIREGLTTVVVDRIKSEVKRYGLAGFEGHLFSELSGGMRQRTDIIRALESRPKLLFCDEPFSAVDFVTRLSLSTRFKQMCKIGGITTLFITHNIEEAIFLGDEILVMSKRPGRIVSRHRPSFSSERQDAVELRQSPEFGCLFRTIWSELEADPRYEV